MLGPGTEYPVSNYEKVYIILWQFYRFCVCQYNQLLPQHLWFLLFLNQI